MKAKLLRTAFRGAFLLASVSMLAPAGAQTGAPSPRVTMDDNGVDLSTGEYLASFASMTIGNGGPD